MKNIKLISSIFLVIVVLILQISCTTGKEAYLAEDDEGICSTYIILQGGNNLPKSKLQPMQSNELENNRIGSHFSGLWNPFYEGALFPDSILDTSKILELGLKRVRLSINDVDWDKAEWSKSEFSIHPSHDDFITSLNENGVTITYILTFWDKDHVAEGGKVRYPRFQKEDEIQRYLAYVRFIVHHFKDRIKYYEIWNEPTIRDSIQWIKVNDYIKLVKRAIPIIRQEYPEAKIVVGGTDYLIFKESQDYLFRILRSDIMPLVDVVSWHPMYGTAPEHRFHRSYYYKYPSIVQKIKDVASKHGFSGEYVADELIWEPPYEADHIRHWPLVYSRTQCAKYLARGLIMHLGMDVTVSLVVVMPKWHTPQVWHTIQNICTLMAGAVPVSLPKEIQNEVMLRKGARMSSYDFSLPNGDQLLALWTDGIAADHDPGIKATVVLNGFAAHEVIGIDVLNGLEQQIITSTKNGNLVINNLCIKDYPIFFRILK